MRFSSVDAVLFDLGNTLVSYYTSDRFYPILEQSVHSVASVVNDHGRSTDAMAAFELAKTFNRERDDLRVWPLSERLTQIFGDPSNEFPEPMMEEMVGAFLGPIFATGTLDPQAIPMLQRLRETGTKTAIVSNTPWGSPTGPWRRELDRWGLLEFVDDVVFCVDTGWRKPATQPFLEAMSRLEVSPQRTVFVGDDEKWDVEGARRAGIEPVLISNSHVNTSELKVIFSLNELIDTLEKMS